MRGTGPSGPASLAGAVEEIDRFCFEGPAEVELEVAAAAATLGIDLSVEVWKERAKDMVGLAARPVGVVERRSRGGVRTNVIVVIGVKVDVRVYIGKASAIDSASQCKRNACVAM